MKDIIIVDTYPNTDEKKVLLKNYLLQLKKTGKDVLLVSHYPIESEVYKLANYFIYDEENFLLPKEKCAITWFANDAETIHLFSHRHCYAIVKNIYESVSFAKNLGYENFIFTEYDTILADEDVYKVNEVFEIVAKNRTGMLFNYNNADEFMVFTNFFGFNVDFFIKNFTLVKSVEEWYTIHPYSSSTESLEYLFTLMLLPLLDLIHVEKSDIRGYFSNSHFNAHNIIETSTPFIYNIDIPSLPMIFIVTKNANYQILVDDELVYDRSHLSFEWLKFNVDISQGEKNVKIVIDGQICFNQSINLDMIETLKEVGTLKKLI